MARQYSQGAAEILAAKGWTQTAEGELLSPTGRSFGITSGFTGTPAGTPTVAEEPADTGSTLDTFTNLGLSDTNAQQFADMQSQLDQTASLFPAAPAAPEQTTDQLDAAIDEAKDVSLNQTNGSGFKNRTSDLTGITYTDKKGFEYDLGPEYDNVVAVKKGNSVKLYKDGEQVGFDAIGLKGVGGETGNEKLKSLRSQLQNNKVQEVYEDFGGQEGALVSEYLSDQQAIADKRANIDERKDADMFGKGGTMDQLNEQVQREADALGISTDDYYSLGMPLRGQMAISDIGELFTETPGEAGYFSPIGPDGKPTQDFGGLGLGTLGSENLAIYQDKAQDRLDELTPYDPATMDPYSEADRGGQFDYTNFNLGPSSMPVAEGVDPVRPDFESNLSNYNLDPNSSEIIPLEGGLNIPGTDLTITAGGGNGGGGPGGGGNGGGNGVVVPPVVPPDVPEVPGGIGVGVPVIGPGVIGGGTGGGGIGTGVIAGTMPDPSTYIVPSTANYGTDERFKDLAPTFDVSKAAMPIFNRNDPAPTIPMAAKPMYIPPASVSQSASMPPPPALIPIVPVEEEEEETILLAEGGIVSLSEGGEPFRNKMGVIGDENMRDGERYYFEDYKTNEIDPQMLITPERLKDRQDADVIQMAATPKGQGITPDFMVDTYYPSLIPRALDGDKVARDHLLEAHSNFDNFTLPEELLLRIKYSSFQHGGVAERGYSHEGVGSLNATARNMFRPMVS